MSSANRDILIVSLPICIPFRIIFLNPYLYIFLSDIFQLDWADFQPRSRVSPVGLPARIHWGASLHREQARPSSVSVNSLTFMVLRSSDDLGLSKYTVRER
jgi:hypothetical protein